MIFMLSNGVPVHAAHGEEPQHLSLFALAPVVQPEVGVAERGHRLLDGDEAGVPGGEGLLGQRDHPRRSLLGMMLHRGRIVVFLYYVVLFSEITFFG